MGNQLNTHLLNKENWWEINQEIKFPKKGNLIIPISKICNEVGDIWECHGAGSYKSSIEVAKTFKEKKYPIIFSLTKKCCKLLLEIPEDYEAYIICNFIKENTPKKYIQWKHQEFLDISKRGDCNFERVEEITKILS